MVVGKNIVGVTDVAVAVFDGSASGDWVMSLEKKTEHNCFGDCLLNGVENCSQSQTGGFLMLLVGISEALLREGKKRFLRSLPGC